MKTIDYNNIHKKVRIMSLSCEKLELFIIENSNEDAYIFNGFGEIKKIPYRDLLKIEKYNMDKKGEGLYYILDENINKETMETFCLKKRNEKNG